MHRPIGERWRRILAASAGALAALAGLTGVREFDQWFHLAWGRAFLREGFPEHDWFLFTYLDRPPPPATEWLGSLGLYLSWLAAGDPGTVLLVGLLIGATAALLVWDALDGGDASWAEAALALVVVALVVGVMRQRALGRPEVFCYPLLAWTLLGARRWSDGSGRAVLAFPLVALLWANIHPSVLFGLGTILLFAAAALASSLRPGAAATARRRALALGAAGSVGAALAFLNPGGSTVLLGVRYGLGLLGIGSGPGISADSRRGLELAHGAILELQAPGLDYYLRSAAGPLVLLVVIGFLLARKRARPAELILAAIALWLAAHAVRFMPFFAIIAAAACARNLRAGMARVPSGSLARWALVPLVPAAAAWSVLSVPLPLSIRPARELFATRAAELLQAAGARATPGLRVYSSIHHGGYLEWRLDAPIFYNDGRLLWPEGDEAVAIRAGGVQDISRLDERWRFDALVVENLRLPGARERLALQSLAPDLMADRRTFALVGVDDSALLYVRRDGRLSKLVDAEYRILTPSRIVTAHELGDPFFVTRFRAEASRAVQENPGCVSCQVGLYLGHLAAGDLDAATRLFPQRALPRSSHPLGNGSLDAANESLAALGRLRLDEGLTHAIAGDFPAAERALRISVAADETTAARDALGRVLEARGDLVQAEAQFRRGIALDASSVEARIDLAMLLERTGRLEEARSNFRAVLKAAPGSALAEGAKARLDALEARGSGR